MKSVEDLKIEDLKKHFKDTHFKIFENLDAYFWVASGSVRDFFTGEEPKDIDIFFSEPAGYELAKDFLISETHGKVVKDSSPNPRSRFWFKKQGITYDIACWNGHGDPACLANNPSDCIKDFDYTVEKDALDSNLVFYSHPDFFEHVEKRLLVRPKPITDMWLITNIRRLNKYLKRGYNIDKDNLIKYLDDQEATFEYRKQFWTKDKK